MADVCSDNRTRHTFMSGGGAVMNRSIHYSHTSGLQPEGLLPYFTDPELLESWICGGWAGVLCEYGDLESQMHVVDGQDQAYT